MRHTQITDLIYCGGALRPGDWEALYARGVRMDLSLQAEARDDFGKLLPEAELWLPADDYYMPSLDQLYFAVRFITDAVHLGKKIVVHCKYGIGRAPMTVACYLTTQDMTARQAIVHMIALRPIVEPNPGQTAVVREFERQWRILTEDR